MPDTITLHIPVSTRIGVPEEERRTSQRLQVTVEIAGDLRSVSQTDDIVKGLDYDEIVAIVREVAKAKRKTLECFAEDLAHAILAHPKVPSVKVSVTKSLPEAVHASVTIERLKG